MSEGLCHLARRLSPFRARIFSHERMHRLTKGATHLVNTITLKARRALTLLRELNERFAKPEGIEHQRAEAKMDIRVA